MLKKVPFTKETSKLTIISKPFNNIPNDFQSQCSMIHVKINRDRSIVTKMLIIIHTHIHVMSLAMVKKRSICKVQNKHLYLAIPTERGLSTLYTLLVNEVLVALH